MSDKKKDYYKNPLGEFSEEDFAKIKQEGRVDEFLRKFRITEQPCPPKRLRPVGNLCFYCEFCNGEAFSKIKIKKDRKGK